MKFKNNLLGYLENIYDALFKYIVEEYGDEWVDIAIEVKLKDGATVKKSWRDRNERLDQ